VVVAVFCTTTSIVAFQAAIRLLQVVLAAFGCGLWTLIWTAFVGSCEFKDDEGAWCVPSSLSSLSSSAVA
jgi:hypothetical protein